MKKNVALCLLATGWVSCAAWQTSGGDHRQDAGRKPASTQKMVAEPVNASASKNDATAVDATATGRREVAPAAETAPVAETAPANTTAPAKATAPALSPAELAMWNDPAFRKRFTESYVAETEIEPRMSSDERDLMFKLRDLIAAGQLDPAEQMVEAARGPASSAALDYALGNIYVQRDQPERAIEAYRTAVGKHPKFRRAWNNLGQILYRQGDFGGAVEAFSRVITLGGGDAVMFGLMGVAHAKLGDHTAAESAFRMASMMDPTNRDWKLGLAEALLHEQRFGDAVTLFDGLVAEQPSRAPLWLAQGEAYARLGQPLKAAENFEMVDQLGGSTYGSLCNLGDIYANQGVYDLAVGAYLRAMKLAPGKKPDRAIRAAKYLCANGATAETRKLVGEIESVQGDRLDDKEKKDLLRLRALLVTAEGGAAEEEIHILEQIVALDPLDGHALLLLGRHARRKGDYEKAMLYYERAADIEAFEADAKVGEAEVRVHQSRYGDAVRLLRQAQEKKPRDYVQKYLDQIERMAQKR